MRQIIFSLFFTRKGSALLLALWCVAVLSITILGVARMVQSDVEDSSTQNRRFEARELALTGIALGMHPKIESWDPLLTQNFAGSSKLRVHIISESSRLDINRMLKEKDRATLKRLFETWGVDTRIVSIAVDSLVDWIDEDDFRLLNGAEKDDLFEFPQYSVPGNRDFHSVSEMEKVRGMDRIAALKPNWADSFTVYGSRRIDLQTASIDVMRAGGLSMEQAKQIDIVRRGADKEMQTRDDFKIKNVTEFLRQVGLSDLQLQAVQSRFGAGMGPVRIDSRAEVGGLEYHITAVVSRGENNVLIAWDES